MTSNDLSHFGPHSATHAATAEGAFAPVEPEPAHTQRSGDIDGPIPGWESAWIDLGGEG